MVGEELWDQVEIAEQVVDSLDHVAPAEQMRAIDAAMRQYFQTSDWLRARNKAFPGLVST